MSKKKKVGIIIGCIVAVFIVLVIITPTAPTPAPNSGVETITASEQNYLTELGENNNTVGEALTELGNLTQNPQIGNDEWTVEVVIQFVTIQIAYKEATEMSPPNSLREVHNKYVQAISCFNDMTYLFAQGIDNNDSELIDEAIQKLEEGSELMDEATAAVNKFKAAHGS